MTLHIGSVGTAIRANTMEPEVLRQLVGVLAGGNIAGWVAGVAGATDLTVVQHAAGANMSVDVSSGLALVAGTQSVPTQGVYSAFNDAAATVAIAASNPTYPRIDVICVSIQDAYYSGATNTGVLQAVTGTPAASPAVPAAPANSLVLAHVYVGANVSTITNSNINGTAGSGNPDTVAYVAPRVGPAGQDGGWITAALVNSWVATAGYFAPGYRLQGNVVRLRGVCSGGATGTTIFTLPVGYRPSASVSFTGWSSGTITAQLAVSPAGVVQASFNAGGLYATLDGLTFTID